MCKHCENGERIGVFKTNVGNIELFIEQDYKEIAINSYNTDSHGFDNLTINGEIKINYCPVCGRKL